MKIIEVTGIFLLCSGNLRAEDPQVIREQMWKDEIAPILKQSCVECHGEKKMKARVRLDTFELAIKGGKRPGVIWGHPEASRIYRTITKPRGTEGAMPPGKREGLADREVAMIKSWIETGPADEIPVAPSALVTPSAGASGVSRVDVKNSAPTNVVTTNSPIDSAH